MNDINFTLYDIALYRNFQQFLIFYINLNSFIYTNLIFIYIFPLFVKFIFLII